MNHRAHNETHTHTHTHTVPEARVGPPGPSGLSRLSMKLQAYPIPQFPSSPAPQPLSPLNPPAPQPLSPLNPLSPLSPSIPQPLNPPALNPPALQSPSPQAFQRSVRLKYFTYKKKTVIGENATSRPAAKHFPRSRFFFICRARARAVGADFRFFVQVRFFYKPMCTHFHGQNSLRACKGVRHP